MEELNPDERDNKGRPADETDERGDLEDVASRGSFPNQRFRLVSRTGIVIREWMVWGSGASNGVLEGGVTWKARRSGGKRLREDR